MNLKRVLLLVCLAAVHSAAASQTLECNVGPVTRSYGNTDWLVYSCSDRKSLVLVSAPGSPAMPFIFSVMAQGGSHKFRGEGTGDKKATAAAWEEISKLTQKEIATLIEQTKASK